MFFFKTLSRHGYGETEARHVNPSLNSRPVRDSNPVPPKYKSRHCSCMEFSMRVQFPARKSL